MIKKIRVLLEYNTYCLWLYDENDEIIGNENPEEWDDDQELTKAFLAVSNIYDTFFIDNQREFRYIGCPDAATESALKEQFALAMSLLYQKNSGKYIIQNDVSLEF